MERQLWTHEHAYSMIGTMNFESKKSTRDHARALRRVQTVAERQLWAELRGRRLAGLRFRRQHPIGPYIVDFCCLECSLIVEVDGDVHCNSERYSADQRRSYALEQMGYCLVRFSNDEVHHDLDEVLRVIERASTQAAKTPLSRRERGRG